MTHNAVDVVKRIVEQNVAVDADAGLRISQDGADGMSFGVAPAEMPEPGDQVLEEGGARIFLDEVAAVSLEDKVLDARVDDDGAVEFAIGSQAQD